MTRIHFLVVCGILLAAPKLFAEPTTRVLHSLKPLQLITQGLTQGELRGSVLPQTTQHAHSVSVRFSDLKLLQQSRLLIWLGPEFEHYLHGPLENLQPAVTDFAYLKVGAQLMRDAAQDFDQTHVWLDPLFVKKMMPLLTDALIAANETRRSRYQRYLESYVTRLDNLDERIQTLLSPYRGLGVVSDHIGLEIFLHRYGLRHTGSLQGNSHQALSLKRARQLRSEIELGNAACIAITQAGNRTGLLQVFDGQQINIAELDLLGRKASSYEALIEQLAQRLAGCLGKH